MDRKEIVFRLITVYPYFEWSVLKDFLEGKKDPEEVLYEVSRHAYERTRPSRGFYYYHDRPKQRG